MRTWSNAENLRSRRFTLSTTELWLRLGDSVDLHNRDASVQGGTPSSLRTVGEELVPSLHDRLLLDSAKREIVGFAKR